MHRVTLRVYDEETLKRVTDEEWEPVLYLPAEPSVALLMGCAAAVCACRERRCGTFDRRVGRSGWLPPALVLLVVAVTLLTAAGWRA